MVKRLFQRRAWTHALSRRRFILLGTAAVLLGAAALLVMYVRTNRNVLAIDPSNLQQVALGQRLYALHCASCHGVDLEGQADWKSRKPDGRLPAPPHDESGHTWHHDDAALFKLTKLGTERVVGGNYRSDMRAFGDQLSDAEIVATLAYIKSRWRPEIQRRQATIGARAAGRSE